MLIETQVAGPFHQNGFIVACDATREAVIIDPGDVVDALLAFAAREQLAIRHISDARPRRSITGVAAAERAQRAGVSAPRRSLPLRPRGRVWRAFRRTSSRSRRSTSITRRDRRSRSVNAKRGRITRRGTVRAASASRLAKRDGRERPLRRRHAVCGLDRPHRSARRRLPDADRIDPHGALRVWRRRGPSGHGRARRSARNAARTRS